MLANRSVLAILVAGTIVACSPGADDADARDLELLPTDSLALLDDAPRPEDMAADQQPAPPQQSPARQATAQPVAPRSPTPPPSLAEGTVATLYAIDTLTSRHNKMGDTVSAFIDEPLRNARGQEIIPAGAVFHGTITDIAPAESPGGTGRMAFAFTSVEMNGSLYHIDARVDSITTYMKGRGVTTGDAVKVGAGTAVGAIAGRIIGGNRTGTIVGAAVGTAAGVGIASATRDIDILLDAGAPLWLVFTAPFEKP